MNPSIQFKKTTSLPLLMAFVLACFGLSPTAQAVDPPPDGGYPNQNTAEGHDALRDLTTGSDNTAIGFEALASNSSGDSNTAAGSGALTSNTTGLENTAIGFQAMESNTSGFDNVATGRLALWRNTTGFYNTADGIVALADNTTGHNNTATGGAALVSNTTGFENTADGFNALDGNTTGHANLALGFLAGSNLVDGNNNIYVGNAGGGPHESNKIRIGQNGTHRHTFIAGISGVTVPNGVTVIIDGKGQLGTVTSSDRYKDEIKPMDKASEAILQLKPVTFRYKAEIDPDKIPQFGLVAEDVEKVNPDLVVKDAEGKVYTVRYEAVNAMLLNEFLKEHRKNQEQETTIAELQATTARQQKQIEALTAGLQKVSAHLELSKPAPQVTDND